MNSSAQSNTDQWFCMTPEDLEIYTFNNSNVILNNFFFDESSSFMSNKYNLIEFSFIARNRNTSYRHLNVQLIGLNSDGQIILAMQPDPLFDILSENSNEAVTADSYILGSVIDSIARICMIIYLDE